MKVRVHPLFGSGNGQGWGSAKMSGWVVEGASHHCREIRKREEKDT